MDKIARDNAVSQAYAKLMDGLPAVPISLANSVEGDFRQPGAADGSLLTNNESTNGLTEHIGTNSGGEMQGNLLAASYDGRLLRIALSLDGTAVTNGLETLADACHKPT
jgi:hypothetical protein